ncbi:MAG TPA: hypothetical protein VFN18_08260 [Solirubrobacterales bacterium]|nr:hypothetical protein [Solirubrobacterales bacterium]
MIQRNAVLIAGACLVLLLSLAVGIGLDPSSFASNLSAEMVGVVVGIGVAVLVVERLVDQDRRARWRLVETQTIATLRFALVKGALPLYLHLPAQRPMEADPFMNKGVGKLGAALENLSAALRADEPTDLKPDPLRGVLDNIAPHLNFVRDIVMQRLLTVGPDPELIRRLAKLESTFEDLDLAAWLDERFGSRPGETTQRMANLADSMKDVVVYLDSE